MDVYGLTGGIGAGKSAVAELLEEYGIPVVSADELSRMVVAKGSDGLRQVVDAFGQQIMDANGELDRRVMAQIVFQNPTKRRQLESILHPLIRERYETVLDALEKGGHLVAVYEVPLLFEKNLQGEMKAVILVTASERNRIARVRARDGMTEDEVRARIAAQMDEDEKRKRADYVVHNDGSLDDLRREVESMLSRFMKLSPPRPSAELMGASERPEAPARSPGPAPALDPGPLSPADLNLTPSVRPKTPAKPQSERATVPPGDPTRPAGVPPRAPRTPTRSMVPGPDDAASSPPAPAGSAPKAPPPPPAKGSAPPPPPGAPSRPAPVVPPPPGAPPSATPTLPPRTPRQTDGDDG